MPAATVDRQERKVRREEKRARQRETSIARAQKMHEARLAHQTALDFDDHVAVKGEQPAYHVGCSGWYYWHWFDVFYPKELPRTEWFQYYASQFRTVELNAPFYCWPTKERDQKGYVIESLWKFLIFTEIGRVAVERIKDRPSGDVFSHETDLVSFYNAHEDLLQDEFTIRLERCVNQLILTQTDQLDSGGQETFRTTISETLHKNFLGGLRIAIGKALKDTNRVAILVDNLDKAWDKTANLLHLSEFLLGLLSAARRIPAEFSHSDKRRDKVNVSLAVFLRSDIFYQMMSVAREPDKVLYSRLTWQDPQLLLRVIDERLGASNQRSLPPEDTWKRYFTESVNSLPIREYIIAHILPRPRDIVFLMKAAISIAINRSHTKVQDIDFLDAQKQYSQYAIDSILVENGISVATLENVIYEFVGGKPLLNEVEAKDIILKSGIAPSQGEKVLDHLCALAFLGVEVADQDFRFAEDFQDYQKLAVLRRKRNELTQGQVRYKINVPFWAFLEISEAYATGEQLTLPKS